jgi:hypothetical protein
MSPVSRPRLPRSSVPAAPTEGAADLPTTSQAAQRGGTSGPEASGSYEPVRRGDPARAAATGPAAPTAPMAERGMAMTRPPSSLLAIRAGAARPDAPSETLRFAKFAGPAVSFPLQADDAAALRHTDAVSPFLPADPRVLVHPADLVPPTHPGDPGYWDELEKVVDVQLARRRGGTAEDVLGEGRVPALFTGYTLEQAAAAVHTDLPSEWPSALLKQLLEEGARVDGALIPQLSQSDFVNSVVVASGVLAMATAAVSPSAFACKWHEGRARPEEAIWAIHQGKLEGAPASLRAKIASLELQRPEDATAYPEGAPRHPSWPAMHSAASISSMVLGVLFDLDERQLREARNLDYAVASFRTVAGVHFESDNLAGLEIGQRAIEAWLPDFLAQCAGADPAAVRAKIARVRYDWSSHPPL